MLHARGMVKTGDGFLGRSIIDSRFDCRTEGETRVGTCPTIVPSISGRAWVTGTRQEMLDPDDLWPEGYRLADTWPNLSGA